VRTTAPSRAPSRAPSAPETAAARVTTRRWVLPAAIAAVLAASVLSLFVGVSDVGPGAVFDPASAQAGVFWASRVPRLAAILLAGASMSVAGLIMQHLARNRFVEPSTAGTIESALLGILVATVFFGGESLLAKMTLSVLFALAGTWLFLRILGRIRFTDPIVVPLVGIMYGGVIGAVTIFFAYRLDLLQSLTAWTAGDFSGVLAGRFELLYLAGGVAVAAYLFANRFTVAGLGQGFAVNLGVNYTAVLNLGLALVAVITAVTVVTVGAIPFLGLVVPNLVTMALGDNLRKVLPVTALAGGAFVLACDVLGRTIRYPYEIPVGVMVGVIGGILFIVLVLRRRQGAR
jgi:iron complex transport system permease protein